MKRLSGLASRILAALDEDEDWPRSLRRIPGLLTDLANEPVDEHRRGETRDLEELLG